MNLAELNRKLIELAARRVRSGDLTERGLARMCSMSQPHMHNVLKGIRSLSNDTADRLMQALGLGIGDLLWSDAGDGALEIRTVPVVRHRIGPGNGALLTLFRGAMPFPAPQLTGLVNPVAARLAPDLVMPRALAANDLLLLDQNPTLRAAVPSGWLWVVAETEGLRVRYLRMGGTLLYVATELTLHEPRKWQPVALRGRNILDIVRARIVWISREMETETDGQAEPAGDCD